MPIRDQEAFLAAGDADALFLCNRGANGIDGLISSGIGAAHASGRPTTIVTGDLGLLHDLGGLAALRDVSTPVRIVVIDNDGGGIFHFLPQEEALAGEEFEALLGTPRGVDAAKAAALFDLPHRRLESLAELPDALAAGTGLIEVRTDRQANVDVHRRLARRGRSRDQQLIGPASRPGPGCQATSVERRRSALRARTRRSQLPSALTWSERVWPDAEVSRPRQRGRRRGAGRDGSQLGERLLARACVRVRPPRAGLRRRRARRARRPARVRFGVSTLAVR